MLTDAVELIHGIDQASWRRVEAVQDAVDANADVERGGALERSEVVEAAKRELAPSSLGRAAHPIVEGATDLLLAAGQLAGDNAARELVERTWDASLHAFADRALVREFADTEQP